MKPLTRQRGQHANKDSGSPLPTPESTQHFRQEKCVVVLGVMYPSAVPPPPKVAPNDSPRLSPLVATDWQSTNVLFYDPISSVGSDRLTRARLPEAANAAEDRERRRILKRRQGARAEAIEAVVRELARLRDCADLLATESKQA